MREVVLALSEYNVLGVDLEYNQVCKMGTVLSLVQLSTVKCDYIIDALQMRDNRLYSELRCVLQDPKVIKVLHGGDSDVQLLAADLDIACVNVFDTARAFQFLQRMP
jgi:exosome complex exonuclease RRP6